MKYLLLVGSAGLAAPQEMAVMNREMPGWAEDMERRGVLLLGRPLELPQTAATVLVRDGEALGSDGGARGPGSWFKTIETRPVADGPWLGEGAAAFGRGEDGTASPYLLAVW